ncbi:Hypothetical protein R9X50_00384900 [Acrodontium crateriforme]|uniref:Uncharacterized protein n=1 Tax=Acrodontium crateriforme TaxID=150365 RepID=A0AAQ3M476_9PEZI|nr:Hypothetical protein R9X50_00384900 [Acrodontium crateriforme]
MDSDITPGGYRVTTSDASTSAAAVTPHHVEPFAFPDATSPDQPDHHRPASLAESGLSDSENPSMPVLQPITNDFDVLAWAPAYFSCQRFFLNHAQHEPATQALCALINIRLPFQWHHGPVTSFTLPPGSSTRASFTHRSMHRESSTGQPTVHSPSAMRDGAPQSTFVSLVPYIRRLVITAFDKPGILHGFFGDDYERGIIPHVDCERRNYLFTAKRGGWIACKQQYDSGSGGGDDETVPFMKPLDKATVDELAADEKAWALWLEMERWKIGPRASGDEGETNGSRAARA